jgi:hypothetical protein
MGWNPSFPMAKSAASAARPFRTLKQEITAPLFC